MVTLCQVGIGLLGASAMVAMLSTGAKKRFSGSLTPEQQAQLAEIARSRFMIYIASILVGGAAGWLVVQGMPSAGWHSVCTAVGVAAVASYFVYRLWPKDKWMLSVLTGNQALGIDAYTQTQLWLEMYKAMCWNFHAGFLVSLAGYAALFRGVCSKAAPASG